VLPQAKEGEEGKMKEGELSYNKPDYWSEEGALPECDLRRRKVKIRKERKEFLAYVNFVNP